MEDEILVSSFAGAAPTSSETQSAVSWGAVFAGAVAALALSFVLMAIAGGLGLKLASPWPGEPGDLPRFTPVLGASLIVVQVLSAALGGYLAGRLRTKWTNVHGHEVHFRDTVHGFLGWAVSLLAGVVLAATVFSPLTGRMNEPTAISAATLDDASAQAAGVAPASTPVDAATMRGRIERDEKIAAQFSLFMGLGLLLGAFTACVAAAIGGLRREEMHTLFWKEFAPVTRPGER